MKLAIFDLDYTIWQPEMFQLYGPPRLVPATCMATEVGGPTKSRRQRNLSPTVLKEAKTTHEGMVLADRDGSPIRVFDGASAALADINRMKKIGYDIEAAVASKTDEPSWAHICLNHLVIEDGTVLKDCFQDRLIEISYGSKTGHVQRLHRKTGIPYEEMAFFDNEYWNIQDVSHAFPVKCFYTPEGMTREAWNEAKAAFGLH